MFCKELVYLGSFDVDSDFDLIIDVVNTTTTIYEVNTSFNISNGLVAVSGRIEGDRVPLTEVSTADNSGQIILNVTITSAGIVDLDQVDIPLTEYIPQVYDYFTFEVNDDNQTVTLTDYDSSLSDSTDVVIPSTVSQNSSGEWIEGNTYAVTAITDGGSTYGVFYDSGITSVTFPSSLTSIGSYAFYECRGLTGELNLGGCTSLTSIGSYAFWYCSGLTSISLPSSLTSIGRLAFSYCSGLTGELNLGECTSLTSIGSSAFSGCSKLTSVDLSGCTSLTSIENLAFSNCRGLTSISLPSSLTSIGERAFSSCRGLTSVDLSGCTNLTSIERYAFQNCSALESVVFPEGSTGWYVTASSTATSGTPVDVTNSSTNASNLTGKYLTYYWKRG